MGFLAIRFQALNGFSDNIIRSDGVGYYAYLPAIFIYNDLQFDFLDNKELVNDDGAARVTLKNDRVVNKYSCGLAILQAPFFVIAYAISSLSGDEATGFYPIFHHFFLFGAIFYFFLGLVFLQKILRFLQIDKWMSFIILLLFAFGNTLLHYLVYDTFLSHSYSLNLMMVLVYYVLKLHKTEKQKNALIIGVVFGLLVLVRPFNLISILCLLVLFISWKEFVRFISILLKKSVFVIVPFFLVVGIQLVLWKLQTGSFLVYSYGGEKFLWGTHDYYFALLGFRRGFLIYNPIWIFVLILLLFHIKRVSFNLFGLLVSLGIIIFLLSSWHSKLYGMSLGYRPLIEYQIFMLFPFLYLYKSLRNKKALRVGSAVLVVLCICYSVMITFQYQRTILPRTGPSFAQFKEMFGKIDGRYTYHFHFPAKLSKQGYDEVSIPSSLCSANASQGISIVPITWTKDSVIGVGYYCDVEVENPKMLSGAMLSFSEGKIPHRKYKLVSKDVKQEEEWSGFYIEDTWKAPSLDSMVIKFDDVPKAKSFQLRNGKVVLYTKPYSLLAQDSL